MSKPKFFLDPEKDIDGFSIINRAGSVLCAHGFKAESKQIHIEAKSSNYDIYMAYILLKKYLDV